ncbi:MAG TPA: hypothetical protein VFA18_04000 [Gemmataceae bacterium]|nr:hypothetical protein [Gemmataceae bacterium]
MNAIPESSVKSHSQEDSRRLTSRYLEEMTRLAEQDITPGQFYSEFLKAALSAIGGSAGAVWQATAQGGIQLRYQINAAVLGFERDAAARHAHDQLLRQAFGRGQPVYLPPHSQGDLDEGGNPTAYGLLLAPVIVDRQIVGMAEVWQDAHAFASSAQGCLHLLVRLAAPVSVFMRNQERRQILGQQLLWQQFEAFARDIHGSLSPAEVAFTVANGARRLIACDRVSVALRTGRRAAVQAVSGADVVEKRSNLIRRMRILSERVLAWNERLVYTGQRDDSLPPAVLKALDAYLAESNSKLLVVQPLNDEREMGHRKRKPRSALVLESFEPVGPPEPLVAQLEMVGRHAATALYNAVEYRRIPCRWLWRPLAALQESLGGKGRLIALLATIGLAALVAAMIMVPYPLRMDAQGQLLPQERAWIYPPVEGDVVRFAEGIGPGKPVGENQSLILMFDYQLQLKLLELNGAISKAQQEIEAKARELTAAGTEPERVKLAAEKREQEFIRDRKMLELRALRERTHSDQSRPGYFWLKSPLTGTVLSFDFKENLVDRHVKPTEPLLRVGNKEKPWEILLKIPQKHIGQVLQAFDGLDPDAELDVDLLLVSTPTRTFKGKLARSGIGGQATPNKDDPSDAEPVVLASVRIEGPDIPPEQQIPRDLLWTGTEVHSKIRCGERSMGYALFYGVWEFAYEKVVFYFLPGK